MTVTLTTATIAMKIAAIIGSKIGIKWEKNRDLNRHHNSWQNSDEDRDDDSKHISNGRDRRIVTAISITIVGRIGPSADLGLGLCEPVAQK